jgi:hypothetical protein
MRERQEAGQGGETGMREGQGGRDMGMRGKEEEGEIQGRRGGRPRCGAGRKKGQRRRCDAGCGARQEGVTKMRGRREIPGCGAGWEK